MCAHIGQNRHIYPPSIFRLHFDSYPLPLLRRFIVGAAIEKNFLFFLNPLSTRSDYTSILILFFSFLLFDFYSYFIFYFFSDFRLDSCFDSVFQIILFNYFDSIKIRHLILDFIFQTLRRFNSHTSFAWYLLVYDSWLRFWFSTRFHSHQFRLVSVLQILHFNSLSL